MQALNILVVEDDAIIGIPLAEMLGGHVLKYVRDRCPVRARPYDCRRAPARGVRFLGRGAQSSGRPRALRLHQRRAAALQPR